MEFLTDSITFMSEFFGGDSESNFFHTVSAWVVIWTMKAKLVLVQNAWLVASEVLVQLDISAFFNDAFNTIPSDALGTLTMFRIPDSLNVVLQSMMARFVLDII